MKRFRRLTKEELDAVHPEFVRFLASEGIAADDWAKKQVHHPEQVDSCLDTFSERFWEGATAAIKYVEHSPSEEDVWVFQFDETSAKLIRCVRAEGSVTWSQGGKRFEQEVTSAIPSIGRPREGDLVHFPLSNTTFEINFVEHENPFYQLGRLYTYQLQCEVFTYSNETVDTGNSIIDELEDDRKGLSGDLVIPTDPSGITAGDNDEMHNLSRSILDFSEKDPFSEGRY